MLLLLLFLTQRQIFDEDIAGLGLEDEPIPIESDFLDDSLPPEEIESLMLSLDDRD